MAQPGRFSMDSILAASGAAHLTERRLEGSGGAGVDRHVRVRFHARSVSCVGARTHGVSIMSAKRLRLQRATKGRRWMLVLDGVIPLAYCESRKRLRRLAMTLLGR